MQYSIKVPKDLTQPPFFAFWQKTWCEMRFEPHELRSMIRARGNFMQSKKTHFENQSKQPHKNRVLSGSMSAVRRRRHTALFGVSDRQIADNPN